MRIYKIIITVFTFVILFAGCKDDDPKPFEPSVDLQINHEWNDSELVLNNSYFWDRGFRIDTITPTTLIYHINNITLRTQDSLVIGAELPYYMVDYGDKTVMPANIKFKAPKAGVKYYITSLEFTIGVKDSLVNSLGLLNSTFITPMWWAMAQGYVNFKFEALTPQAPGNALIYHIGGYKKPYYNSRKVRVIFDKPYYLNRENSLAISANVFKLFKSKYEIDITITHLIHTPDDDSKMIADNMAEMFGFDSFK